MLDRRVRMCSDWFMANTEHTSIRISADLMAMVDEEAARRKWSRNVTLVTALEYGLPDMMREVVGGGKNAARGGTVFRGILGV